MRCPNCNSTLSLKNNRCDRCGQDVKIYKRIVKASNAYYNQGLMKAKVRDLSGAVVALKKSLELDKRNTNARNLLGLVYFEMGEAVSALSEWVLSKHFQPDENDADEYMDMIQNNPTKLDTINQAIKKYNSALTSAQQGSGDLAIIQLKKVVTLNPNFIRAYQLLALLYMQQGEKDRAERMLRKANKIDLNNTITLKYLKEIGASATKITQENQAPAKDIKKVMSSEPVSYMPVGSYEESKPNLWPYLFGIICLIVGVCVTYFLLVPQAKKSGSKQQTKQIQTLQAQLSNEESEKAALQKESSQYKKQVEELNKELKEYKGDTDKDNGDTKTTGGVDAILEGASLYLQNKNADAAAAILDVDIDKIDNDKAKALYNTIKDKTFKNAYSSIYSQGWNLFNKGKYDEALKNFKNARKLQSDDANSYFGMGRCYEMLDKKEDAIKIYNDIVDNYKTKNNRRYTMSRTRLRALGQSVD
ncbi:hypothetical protein lbkm_4264 [Lachnospiraceae bacterium KM106-2]|nr:hypothetical protein lbkm_4264 [Lachnospiraceae bacterium KM106-2]